MTATPAVMHVALSLSPGGAERMVIEIAKRLSPRHRTVVCCLDEPGAWAGEVEAHGMAVVALGRPPGFRPEVALQIAEVAAAHRVSILHCHQYSSFVYGQLAALRRRRLRVIFTEHGRFSDAPPSIKRRLVNPVFGRLPDAICAVSEELRRHMIAEGFPPGRVEVIPNGVEPGPRATLMDRLQARRALGVDEGAFVVGTAARLDPVKDLTTLVGAFRLLSARVAGARLVIMGDGPERVRLTEAAARAGLGDVVVFAGQRTDLRQLLPGLDVYVNCSTSEGVSVTILEAMAASLPVVATRAGGNPEVVNDGHTGRLIGVRSPQALAAALDALAAAPGQRARLGSAGRARVERHFAMDGVAGAYARKYSALAEP